MSVQITDNTAAVKSALEKSIGKTLESMGIHFIDRATKEANELIYHAPEARSGYVRTGRYQASLSYATLKRESGLIASAPGSERSDALSGRSEMTAFLRLIFPSG